MAIPIGADAPDFTLKNQDEKDWTLSDHRGRNVVLLWYPLDWSPTCEAENCRIGKDVSIEDENTIVVGISRDSTWSHKAFREHRDISHELLSDPMLEVTREYDLVHPAAPFISHRATVIVDKDGKVAWTQIQESTAEERDWDEVREAVARL